MSEAIELSTIDLRYESYRLRNAALEGQLLASIAERGITEPLEGVEKDEARILLNGFKRYRSARKLGLAVVPYRALGEDEAEGILAVLRSSSRRGLSILEEARFLDELLRCHALGVSELAELLGRSKSWVSMRLGLLGELTDGVRERLFAGDFPVYSYMYTLRPLMRMNSEGRKLVEDFVQATSRKKLSTRQIEQLACGYFRGPESFREEIRAGHLRFVLEEMKQVPQKPDGLSEFERLLLKDLDLVGRCMRRVVSKSRDRRLGSRTFHAQVNLLTAGVLSRVPAFKKTLEELHDRSRDA